MKQLIHLSMLVLIVLQSLSLAMDVLAKEASRAPAAWQEQTGSDEDPTGTPTETLTETATATITPEDGSSPTPTDEFEPPPTPDVTATPEASATPGLTPTITEQPVDEQTPVPADHEILLTANPEFITPGGQVNLQWQVAGEGLDGLDLVFVLPYGAALKSDKKSDTPESVYRISAEEKGGLHLDISSDAEMPVIIQAFLLPREAGENFYAGPAPLAGAHISLIEKTNVSKSGGKVAGLNGKVKVTFSDGALAESAEVFIHRPLPESMPSHSLSGRPFEVNARGAKDGKGISTFADEVRIEVDYSYLNLDDAYAADLALYWYNEESGEWEILPSYANTETKTLHASTTHFTIFDINIHNWQASRLPTLDNFQVSGFTGAGTFSLPIEVPPGPGGLQPSLALTYNSQVIDQSLNFSQASWAGMGWSLDTGMIERNTKGTTGDTRDDTFFLTLNGVSSMIVRDANGYHLADENFWKIKKLSSPDSWVVQDKVGNTYYFEYIALARYIYDNGSSCGALGSIAYQWHLTRVRNIHGKELTYTYNKETKIFKYDIWAKNSSGVYGCRTKGESITDTAVYPHTIVYPHGYYRVRFELADRSDYKTTWATSGAHESFMRRRLSNIYVEQDADGNGSFETVIRRYQFSYAGNSSANIIWPGISWTAGGKTSTLIQVREYGLGGQALPAHTFIYADNMHLTRAENGYGGAVEFDYQPWVSNKHAPRGNTLIDMTYYGNDTLLEGLRIMRSCNNTSVPGRIHGFPGQGNSWCEWYGGVQRYALHIWGTVVTATPESLTQVRPGGFYRLTPAVWPTNGNTISAGLWDGVTQHWQPAVGNAYQLPANRSKAEMLISATGTNNWSKVEWAKMELVPAFYRVTQKRVYDGQGNQYPFNYTYQGAQVNHTGLVNAYCPLQNNGNHVWLYKVDPNCREYTETNSQFRGHSQVTETGPNGLKTITQYHQGDVLKGRPISVSIKDSGNVTLSQKLFNYDSNTYAVIQPIWAGNCTNCPSYIGLFRAWARMASQESRVYASDGSYSATREVYTYEATYGNQTLATRQAWNGSEWQDYLKTETNYSPNTSGVYLVGIPNRIAQINPSTSEVIAVTLFFYDGNTGGQSTPPTVGKLTSQRTRVADPWTDSVWMQVSYTYDTWGNRTSETAWSGYGASNASPTQGGRTMTTTFDPTYRTYPVSSTNPLNQTVSWTYNYSLGVPLSETDPNGAVTSATYDNFGRMTKLIRPGDDSANPTIKIAYFDTASPFRIELSQRVAGAQYLTLRRYYDGMGRQFKTESGNTVSGAFSLFNTTQTLFDSPTVIRQSLPYGPGETPVYTTSETRYEGGTKISTALAPDGSQTTSVANGLTASLTDPAGRTSTSQADAWGRTVSVIPPDGPAVTYAYDLLGRLTSATRGEIPGGGGATTSLAYDMAGRKIAMSDPDMGNWTYAYDALGNLTGQTDARGCTLTLAYDPLNRLTGKTSAGNCGTQVSTTYTYDAGANGKGRRTGMQDASTGSGSTTWAYDARGRVTIENKRIGSQIYTTQWTYNSADLPLTMTYPDGEVVTNNYTPQMMLNSVAGDLTYVFDTQYDSAGRMTKRRLGGELPVGDPPAPPPDPVFSDVPADHWARREIEGLYGAGVVENCGTSPLRYCPGNQVTRATVAVDILRAKYGSSYNPPTPASQRFTDVPTTHWAYKWIDKFAADGITAGCTATTYCPDGPTLRIQMIIFLLRAKHGGSYVPPAVPADGHIFADMIGLSTEAWAVAAKNEGITDGCDGGVNFCPNQNVTREMEAVLVARTFNIIPPPSPTPSPEPVASPVIEQTYTYYDWDQQGGRLQSLTTTGLQELSYQYDLAGNITQIQDSIAAETQAFGYDDLDRLTSWTLNGTLQETYAYDPLTGNLASKAGLSLAYTDPGHVHAVTHLTPETGTPNTYTYDANGNQVSRNIANEGQYELLYDAENRLVEVKKDSVTIAQFVFDGDGKRVKSVADGETILFVGGHYEIKGDEITKYYFAGASRVAMRKYIIPESMTLEFILGDHLGSTSLTTDAAGAKTSEMRYSPWGEVRYTWTKDMTPGLPSRYTFTGQYSYMDDPTTTAAEGFGLMFYNARWYDTQLGRFAQADTIVPGGAQGLDRYAYVNNSPVMYVDPSGHFSEDAIKKYLKNKYGDDWNDIWTAWSSDDDWMKLLYGAEGGDILSRVSCSSTNDCSIEHYQFVGDGQDSLDDFVNVSDLAAGSQSSEKGDINGIFSQRGNGIGVARFSKDGSVSIIGKLGDISYNFQTVSIEDVRANNVGINLSAWALSIAFSQWWLGLGTSAAQGYFAPEISSLPQMSVNDVVLTISVFNQTGPIDGKITPGVRLGWEYTYRNGNLIANDYYSYQIYNPHRNY